ncbi:MAG: DUF424 family protein [Ferroplasma sp.]
MERINMKILNVRGEIMLAAADSNIIDKEFREGKLHIKVSTEFYGNIAVSDEVFISSLNLCTIANLVGEHVVNTAIDANYIDKDNVIRIDGVPHAQMAKMI